jgi:hypothetical protein
MVLADGVMQNTIYLHLDICGTTVIHLIKSNGFPFKSMASLWLFVFQFLGFWLSVNRSMCIEKEIIKNKKLVRVKPALKEELN